MPSELLLRLQVSLNKQFNTLIIGCHGFFSLWLSMFSEGGQIEGDTNGDAQLQKIASKNSFYDWAYSYSEFNISSLPSLFSVSQPLLQHTQSLVI